MAQSLFQRKPAEPQNKRVSPIELIEHEIDHVRRRASARHGTQPQRRASVWLLVLLISGALLLYILDPIEHAWYKGDAVRAYLYLHNYGTGHDADQLAACGILRPEEIGELNLLHGSYQDYYTSPQSAAAQAQTIIGYMAQAKALRVGPYDSLNWLERVRYTLFVHDGLTPPAKWDFLDPGLSQ